MKTNRAIDYSTGIIIRILLVLLISITAFAFNIPSPALAASITIFTRTPGANAVDVDRATEITVQFSSEINATTVDENTFNVDGSISGLISGSYSTDSYVVTVRRQRKLDRLKT